ncbi:hypothetical protein Hs30E_19960 [Lactococcus hodotermopsidis]|uniref:Uncharacterized protein n=1 Tax=Pseudolactococcus hodotermopsidis TaxID=2709157 RepID=A0A6A0BFG1_9LACT|nr:hypothetical protein [Lactococcus hodotermopsidis]GFH43445.1 hypothetical protein Hs30E_19960 [Lactococcus hodotermopsidis]
MDKDIENAEIALRFSQSYTKLQAEKNSCIESFGYEWEDWFSAEKQKELDRDERQIRRLGFISDTSEVWTLEDIEYNLKHWREQRNNRNFDTTDIRQGIQDLREKKEHEKRAIKGYSGPSL